MSSPTRAQTIESQSNFQSEFFRVVSRRIGSPLCPHLYYPYSHKRGEKKKKKKKVPSDYSQLMNESVQPTFPTIGAVNETNDFAIKTENSSSVKIQKKRRKKKVERITLPRQLPRDAYTQVKRSMENNNPNRFLGPASVLHHDGAPFLPFSTNKEKRRVLRGCWPTEVNTGRSI